MPVKQTPPLRRLINRIALTSLLVVLLVYPLDWTIWRIRMAMGSGMGSVVVNQTTAATLKGNRFEVYSEQMTSANCSRSLLPQAGAGPCWWLRQHPQQTTQY
jgi:hypothetical protein